MGELRYKRLTKPMVTDRVVEDINNLLPQLTSDAQPHTASSLRGVIDSGTSVFVALDGERIVGTVLLVLVTILAGRKAWIEDVIVDQEYRGHGVAGRLMETAEEVCRNFGAMYVSLTSSPERNSARKMYERRGYELYDTGVYRLKLK